MLSFDSLPQARVVRTHGKLIAPPPAPKRSQSAAGRFVRESAEIMLGMWPVTAVMLFAVALLVMVGHAANY
jgi:hypothetical protein